MNCAVTAYNPDQSLGFNGEKKKSLPEPKLHLKSS